MNICFIMYPWENVDPDKDSTLRIIHECIKRKHRVVVATPAGLTMRNSVTNVFGKVLTAPSPFPGTIPAFYKKVKLKDRMLPLAGFDVVFMRANPPLDIMMLNFLDSVRQDVFILNDIQGLREANNKLYTASLYDPTNDIIPITHVSKNKEFLKKTILESKQDKMIMKPLDGMGGRGVIVIEKDAVQNINSLLDFYISTGDGNSNYVILQEYIEGAENGDVRVLMLNGEPIGAMKRIPAADDHRSNFSAGGSVKRHALTKREKDLCKYIGPKLVEDGLYFVGLDIINGKLIEVNVCSPGGIVNINKLHKVKLQSKVVDFLENVVKYKSIAQQRKSEFRETVQNA
ncbi:glutathione synthase [Paracrocinitomix mangrovi]|uniref:glutathione synthase n=1 Tax=Paracrocinitomix mangrovi TaxID=2862509 RepID=UPI001C8F04CB|nr:glutathione synthase [Paracrocinitomix mangrovi]UKN03202.1 glutathione synthase [Paracrocinitomix mangrovi]